MASVKRIHVRIDFYPFTLLICMRTARILTVNLPESAQERDKNIYAVIKTRLSLSCSMLCGAKAVRLKQCSCMEHDATKAARLVEFYFTT